MSNTAVRSLKVDWHGAFGVAWIAGQPFSFNSSDQLWRIVRTGQPPAAAIPAEKPRGPTETVEQFLARGGKITPAKFPEAKPKITLELLGLAVAKHLKQEKPDADQP